MPCYETRRIQVELKLANLDLVADAFEEIGLEMVTNIKGFVSGYSGRNRYTYNNGKLYVPSNVNVDAFTRQVKREYSKATIKKAAKQFGWKVKKVTASKFAVSKRMY